MESEFYLQARREWDERYGDLVLGGRREEIWCGRSVPPLSPLAIKTAPAGGAGVGVGDGVVVVVAGPLGRLMM
jgi:hypothetical protein